MRWLFSLLLSCAYVVAFPWFVYRALRHGKRCHDWRQRFLGLVPVRSGSGECIWFHAVSVGEVNLLSPLIQRIVALRPDLKLVISATTKTGFDLAQQRFKDHTVFFAPIDFHWAVRRVLRRIRPTILVLCELELWPNLIGLTRRQGVPVAVINGRISERSFAGYRRTHWLLNTMFSQLSLVAVQNEEYAQRFTTLGINDSALTITGAIKFDGVCFDRQHPSTRHFRTMANFAENEVVFLAGSTEAGEERIVYDAYQQLKHEFNQLRLVIVPRHIDRTLRIIEELEQAGLTTVRRTDLNPTRPLASNEVLIVDTIGELSGWWGLADIGFVGGSFGNRGGQNMLEPAALGVATCFGPNTRNFRQIVQVLLDAQAAVELSNPRDLQTFIRKCITDPDYAIQLRTQAREIVRFHQGATDKTVRRLFALLDHNNPSTRVAA